MVNFEGGVLIALSKNILSRTNPTPQYFEYRCLQFFELTVVTEEQNTSSVSNTSAEVVEVPITQVGPHNNSIHKVRIFFLGSERKYTKKYAKLNHGKHLGYQ